ncbi:MAG: GAF domain-containing protein [Cyanobacteriota bacterium]|nr:GAF domain-containing protein [Cyanobacteriota bacterium]
MENLTGGVILIVDDTPTNLRVLCDFLTDSGFEVLVAVDGESAIAQTIYAQPNLILLDVLMPGIDGFETCRQLKANPSTQAIPVIFMTALGETVDKVRGFQVGAVDYVTKPIQPEEVLARIANHLTIQNLQNQLQEQNLRLQQEVKERQQAEELVRQQAQQEQLLGEIAQRIRRSLNLDKILSTTVSEVRQFLQTDRVLIYRFFDDWSGVVAVESVSNDELSILNTTISDSCFGEAYVERYQKGRILVIEDIYAAGLAPCHVDFLLNIQVRANLVVPIIQRERLWGLLIAHHCYEPRQWQPLEVDFLEALSTQIAIAIQQGQLHQRLRRQNQVLVALAKSRTVNHGDLNSALKQITEAATQTLEISRVGVWLYSSDHSKIHCLDLFESSANHHTHGMELTAADYPAYFKALEQEPTLAVPAADTNPIALELQPSYPQGGSTVVGSSSVTARLDAPIRMAVGQVVGVVCYEHTTSSRSWTLDEQNFAGSLADLVSLSLEARDRQRAQEALRLAEQRYHSIVENAIEGIFQTTQSGRFLSANPALPRIFGYSSPEELMASIKDISRQVYVDPNRRGEFIAAIQADNAVFEFDSLVYRKDGSIIWVSENARAVRDSTGALLYYEGTISDITARKVSQEALRYQQEQTDQLLLNILPQPIAERLKRYPSIIADTFDAVSVLFADIVGFTEFSARTSPAELVIVLNLIFSKFDQLAERHGLEKIKTIGDAYMVVAGLPTPRPDHAIAIADMALDMQAEMVKIGEQTGEAFKLRIGINSGPVTAGVIGIKKFFYDLWGDTVNVASRMESQGVDGAIQVTAATYELLGDKYLFEERGVICVKGKGDMSAYLLTGRQFDDSLLARK